MHASATPLALYLPFLVAASLTAQDKPGPKLLTYDVRDLVAPATTAVANASAKANEPTLTSPALTPPVTIRTGKVTSDGMRKFLTHFIDPQLAVGESIRGHKGTVLARVTQAKKQWIASVLEVNRAHAKSPLVLESKLLSVEGAVYRKHVQPLLGKRQHAILDSDERIALVRTITTLQKSAALRSPVVTTFPLHTAALTVANQTSYIKDHEVEIQTAKAVTKPIVGIVSDGLWLDYTAGFLDLDTLGVEIGMVAVELGMQHLVAIVRASVGGNERK